MGIARELAELGSAYNSGGINQFRNRIINGDCRIDQRNAGASVTPANGAYCPDRWRAELTQSSKYSVQQVSDSPDGFVNSLKITSLSSYSITSTDQFNIRQAVEGFNTADLMYGTANAKTITVSFWVKSSLTGTFGASLANSNNTLLYNFNYTINAANTWEYKTSTIVGPTSGTWQTTTSTGIYLRFNLGLGATYGSTTTGSWVSGTDIVGNPSATSVVGTNGATLYITGVQLEKGSTATSFDYRPYGTELVLCQRYFYSTSTGFNNPIGVGVFTNSNELTALVTHPVPMRTSPTISVVTGTNFYGVYRGGTVVQFNGFTIDVNSPLISFLRNSSSVTGTSGVGGIVTMQSVSSFIGFSAEL
jgi:hypothetical protein